MATWVKKLRGLLSKGDDGYHNSLLDVAIQSSGLSLEDLTAQKREWLEAQPEAAISTWPEQLIEHFFVVGLPPDVEVTQIADAISEHERNRKSPRDSAFGVAAVSSAHHSPNRRNFEANVGGTTAENAAADHPNGGCSAAFSFGHDKPPQPSYPGTVLYRFPEDVSSPLQDQELADLCFPHGVHASKLRRTPSFSSLHQLVSGTEHRAGSVLVPSAGPGVSSPPPSSAAAAAAISPDGATPPESQGPARGLGGDAFLFGGGADSSLHKQQQASFVFLLKMCTRLPLYGICRYVTELVHRPPHLARHEYPSCQAPFRSCLITAPRCYCILSHYPFFDLHLQVLQNVINLERLHRAVDYNKEWQAYEEAASAYRGRLKARLQLAKQSRTRRANTGELAASLEMAAAGTTQHASLSVGDNNAPQRRPQGHPSSSASTLSQGPPPVPDYDCEHSHLCRQRGSSEATGLSLDSPLQPPTPCLSCAAIGPGGESVESPSSPPPSPPFSAPVRREIGAEVENDGTGVVVFPRVFSEIGSVGVHSPVGAGARLAQTDAPETAPNDLSLGTMDPPWVRASASLYSPDVHHNFLTSFPNSSSCGALDRGVDLHAEGFSVGISDLPDALSSSSPQATSVSLPSPRGPMKGRQLFDAFSNEGSPDQAAGPAGRDFGRCPLEGRELITYGTPQDGRRFSVETDGVGRSLHLSGRVEALASSASASASASDSDSDSVGMEERAATRPADIDACVSESKDNSAAALDNLGARERDRGESTGNVFDGAGSNDGGSSLASPFHKKEELKVFKCFVVDEGLLSQRTAQSAAEDGCKGNVGRPVMERHSDKPSSPEVATMVESESTRPATAAAAAANGTLEIADAVADPRLEDEASQRKSVLFSSVTVGDGDVAATSEVVTATTAVSQRSHASSSGTRVHVEPSCFCTDCWRTLSNLFPGVEMESTSSAGSVVVCRPWLTGDRNAHLDTAALSTLLSSFPSRQHFPAGTVADDGHDARGARATATSHGKPPDLDSPKEEPFLLLTEEVVLPPPSPPPPSGDGAHVVLQERNFFFSLPTSSSSSSISASLSAAPIAASPPPPLLTCDIAGVRPATASCAMCGRKIVPGAPGRVSQLHDNLVVDTMRSSDGSSSPMEAERVVSLVRSSSSSVADSAGVAYSIAKNAPRSVEAETAAPLHLGSDNVTSLGDSRSTPCGGGTGVAVPAAGKHSEPAGPEEVRKATMGVVATGGLACSAVSSCTAEEVKRGTRLRPSGPRLACCDLPPPRKQSSSFSNRDSSVFQPLAGGAVRSSSKDHQKRGKILHPGVSSMLEAPSVSAYIPASLIKSVASTVGLPSNEAPITDVLLSGANKVATDRLLSARLPSAVSKIQFSPLSSSVGGGGIGSGLRTFGNLAAASASVLSSRPASALAMGFGSGRRPAPVRGSTSMSHPIGGSAGGPPPEAWSNQVAKADDDQRSLPATETGRTVSKSKHSLTSQPQGVGHSNIYTAGTTCAARTGFPRRNFERVSRIPLPPDSQPAGASLVCSSLGGYRSSLPRPPPEFAVDASRSLPASSAAHEGATDAGADDGLDCVASRRSSSFSASVSSSSYSSGRERAAPSSKMWTAVLPYSLSMKTNRQVPTNSTGGAQGIQRSKPHQLGSSVLLQMTSLPRSRSSSSFLSGSTDVPLLSRRSVEHRGAADRPRLLVLGVPKSGLSSSTLLANKRRPVEKTAIPVDAETDATEEAKAKAKAREGEGEGEGAVVVGERKTRASGGEGALCPPPVCPQYSSSSSGSLVSSETPKLADDPGGTGREGKSPASLSDGGSKNALQETHGKEQEKEEQGQEGNLQQQEHALRPASFTSDSASTAFLLDLSSRDSPSSPPRDLSSSPSSIFLSHERFAPTTATIATTTMASAATTATSATLTEESDDGTASGTTTTALVSSSLLSYQSMPATTCTSPASSARTFRQGSHHDLQEVLMAIDVGSNAGVRDRGPYAPQPLCDTFAAGKDEALGNDKEDFFEGAGSGIVAFVSPSGAFGEGGREVNRDADVEASRGPSRPLVVHSTVSAGGDGDGDAIGDLSATCRGASAAGQSEITYPPYASAASDAAMASPVSEEACARGFQVLEVSVVPPSDMTDGIAGERAPLEGEKQGEYASEETEQVSFQWPVFAAAEMVTPSLAGPFACAVSSVKSGFGRSNIAPPVLRAAGIPEDDVGPPEMESLFCEKENVTFHDVGMAMPRRVETSSGSIFSGDFADGGVSDVEACERSCFSCSRVRSLSCVDDEAAVDADTSHAFPAGAELVVFRRRLEMTTPSNSMMTGSFSEGQIASIFTRTCSSLQSELALPPAMTLDGPEALWQAESGPLDDPSCFSSRESSRNPFVFSFSREQEQQQAREKGTVPDPIPTSTSTPAPPPPPGNGGGNGVSENTRGSGAETSSVGPPPPPPPPTTPVVVSSSVLAVVPSHKGRAPSQGGRSSGALDSRGTGSRCTFQNKIVEESRNRQGVSDRVDIDAPRCCNDNDDSLLSADCHYSGEMAGGDAEAGSPSSSSSSPFDPERVLREVYGTKMVHPGEVLYIPMGLSSARYLRPQLPRKFTVVGSFESIASYADEEAAESVKYWALETVCRSLSLENVLLLLTTALLERQAVVFCPNLNVLSAVTLSLLALLRPFAWHSLLMPVLPISMLGLLDAPVPFIVGLQYKTPEVAAKCVNLIRVNVYKNQVKVPQGVTLPRLPRIKQLYTELLPHYNAILKTAAAAAPPVPTSRLLPLSPTTSAASSGPHTPSSGLSARLRNFVTLGGPDAGRPRSLREEGRSSLSGASPDRVSQDPMTSTSFPDSSLTPAGTGSRWTRSQSAKEASPIEGSSHAGRPRQLWAEIHHSPLSFGARSAPLSSFQRPPQLQLQMQGSPSPKTGNNGVTAVPEGGSAGSSVASFDSAGLPGSRFQFPGQGLSSTALPTDLCAACDAFLACLRKHLSGLVGDLRSHVITNVGLDQRTGIVMKDSVLESAAPRDRQFVRQFMETQTFTVWSDGAISSRFEEL